MSTLITRVRQKQIGQSIDAGKRLDGRALTDYREIKIEQGLIEKAEGSARIHLGKTEILVGVKVGIGEPFPDTPNEGVLTVNAELVPLGLSKFRARTTRRKLH
jgi:exosome complex component RRP42